jgi:hypothetical protein
MFLFMNAQTFSREKLVCPVNQTYECIDMLRDKQTWRI